MATATAPAVTSRSQAKLVFFVVFFALTFVALYDKDARVFDPMSPIAQHFAPAKWYVLVHGFFAAIAMAVAAFQFSNRLRARYLHVHRALGYTYVISVCLASPLAVAVAMKLSRSPSQFVANWHELIRLGRDNRHRTVLHSQWQHCPAPAMDDPQLSLGYDVYFQPPGACNSAEHARRPSWF